MSAVVKGVTPKRMRHVCPTHGIEMDQILERRIYTAKQKLSQAPDAYLCERCRTEAYNDTIDSITTIISFGQCLESSPCRHSIVTDKGTFLMSSPRVEQLLLRLNLPLSFHS